MPPRSNVLLLLGCLLSISSLGNTPNYANLRTLRSMSDEDAQKQGEVRVRGVVTLLGDGLASPPNPPPVLSSFCIENNGDALWITMSKAIRENIWEGPRELLLSLSEGNEIEIEGIVTKGSFAQVLLPKRIQILGKKELPPPRPVSLAKLMSGAEDLQRIQVSGVVQNVVENPHNNWLLTLETGLGHVLVTLPKLPDFAPEQIIDAEIQLTGIASSSRNWRAEFICPRLIVRHINDVVFLKNPPADPFSVPKVPLSALDAFNPDGRPLHRRRVEGIVTYHEPGKFLVLQEGLHAVRVNLPLTTPIQPGDRVEASGFIDKTREVAALSGALLRKTGTALVPSAVPAQLHQIVTDLKSRTAPQRFPYGVDDLLVKVSGRLLSIQSTSPDGPHRLELDCGDSTTSVSFLQNPGSFLPGAELEITGIAQPQYAPFGQSTHLSKPIRLDLLARDKNDVLLKKAPSWWTQERTSRALAGVGVVALGGLVWAAVLRHALQKKSRELAREMRHRRDAALEFQAALRERTRLAANLHDTVLQTMTGLAYQIEACESESIPPEQRQANHLDLARRMVQRGQDDLRNSVWALRALPLKGNTFLESIRSIARQTAAGHPVQIDVESAGTEPPLADFIAGNLLLIAQEAIHNALKHARASRIQITLNTSADGTRVSLCVEDNGSGFEKGRQPGADSGHFGLDGMKERTERLQGTLEIQSQPDSGTSIRVEVPLLSFDQDLA